MNNVFVYGTLKYGYSNHALLHGCRCISLQGETKEKFTMSSNGYFPAITRDVTPFMGRIYGEVYEVEQHILKRLDYLESEGSMYKRNKAIIEVPSGLVLCFIYIYLHGFLGDIVYPINGVLEWREK